MKGLSPKIISEDSQRSENAQTRTYKYTISYMKFKLKLLQIECHVLKFIKDEAQKMIQKIIRVFAEAFISHDRLSKVWTLLELFISNSLDKMKVHCAPWAKACPSF
jgi:hypothetical protein